MLTPRGASTWHVHNNGFPVLISELFGAYRMKIQKIDVEMFPVCLYECLQEVIKLPQADSAKARRITRKALKREEKLCRDQYFS